MIVVNSDALQLFLNEELKSRCNADPQSLCRYVMALLKKKRKEKELRVCLLEALDVFLGKETISFVELLLESLKSESYITKHTQENGDQGSEEEIKKVKEAKNTPKTPPTGNEMQAEKDREKEPKENEGRYQRSESAKASSNPIVPHPNQLRCKAYDELGFCMAGNACSFFHGMDALVVDDVHDIFPNKSALMVPHGEIIPPLPTQSFSLPPLPPEPPLAFPTHPPPGVPEAYNPEHPAISAHTPPSPYTRKRELVVLPRESNAHAHKRKAFDYTRLGPKPAKVFKSEETTAREPNTIQLQNFLSNTLNTIHHLNALFSKYGTIINIEIGPQCSFIRFEKPCEAESAFRNSPNSNFDLVYNGEVKKTTTPHAAYVPQPKVKPRVIFTKLKKERDPRDQTAVSKRLDILKKKQLLLNARIENYKIIVAKMSTKNTNTNKYEFLKQTLEKASNEILTIKNEIKSESTELKKYLDMATKKTPYMHSEKALLDAEMDFYHSKSLLRPSKSYEETNKNLLSEVNELKEKAKWLGLYQKEASGESTLPEPNSNEVFDRDSLSEVNLATISAQEEQQKSDILKSDSLLLGDDEEEDEDEDSEARSWRR